MTSMIGTILAETVTNSAAYMFGMFLGFAIMLAIPVMFILSLIKFILTKGKGWLIMLIISILLGCGMIILIGYEAYKAFQKSGGISSASEKGVRAVETDDGLLTLDLPKGWRALDELSDTGSLGYGNLWKEHYVLVISEEKANLDESFTLMDYGELCLENTKGVASKFEKGEWSSLEVAGSPMMQIELNTVVDNIKINYLNGYYETENHYHQIVLWTLPSKWEKSKPVFQSVLKSVRLSSSDDAAQRGE